MLDINIIYTTKFLKPFSLKFSLRRKRADMYVKILRKLATEGDGFAQKETERTKKMLEGKITDAKKTELKEKINILRSFIKADASADGDKKEEL